MTMEPTVESLQKQHLISDVIQDFMLGGEEVRHSSFTTRKHPAQAVVTPGKVLSVWGGATKEEDFFIPFFSQKAMNFDGELSRLKHRLGILCYRGHKPESPNQDDFFVLARSESVLFGIMDGHGPEGHNVAHFAQENLPTLVMEHMRQVPDGSTRWEDAVKSSLKGGHGKALAEMKDKVQNSGCTVTMLMLEMPPPDATASPKVRCAWLGDSLAVAAKRPLAGGAWEMKLLVNCHRPDRPDELQRITECGGKVKDARLVTPKWSLAMSRSFGDFDAAAHGLSHEAEFFDELELESGFEHFLLVCSDGIWDMIPPMMAVNLVGKFGPLDAQLAVDRLVHKAKLRWQAEGDVVDDITAILLWPAENTALSPTSST